MKQDFVSELTPEVREKMKKNLVYIGIFSVVMLFAGFTSAYIVSMGDSFWVKYKLPPAFYISTALILLSSIVLEIGIRRARKGYPKAAKIAVPLTFLLGIGFAVYQWIGYGQLVENGAYVSSKITVATGRYGSYYELKVNGNYLDVDGNDFLICGKIISENEKKGISEFAGQLENITQKGAAARVRNYGKYSLLYKHQEVHLKNGQFYIQDTIPLQYVDLLRMSEFSVHLRDGRGDFFHKGKYGKDFTIYYKGKELQYKNRQLYFKGSKLNAPLQLKMDDTADSASSYLYLITALHLLHILATLLYMLKMSIYSFSTRLEQYSYLSIRLGAIFWHFLGLLWVYLLLFLLFIH